MKRTLTILTIMLAALTFNTRAHAEGGYFGIRGDAFVPIANSNPGGTSLVGFGIAVPFFGIQGGYDFSDRTEPGFSLRGSFRTLIFLSQISLDALYRIPDETGAGLYFGAGVDMAFVLVVTAQSSIFGAHLDLGYDLPISSTTSVFFEAQPGAYFNSTGALFYFSLAAGFNFHFS